MARFEMVTCADGFTVSIQAVAQLQRTKNRYQPRIRKCGTWLPQQPCIFIKDYAEDPRDLTGTVYGYVPAHIVRKMIAAHGGIVSVNAHHWWNLADVQESAVGHFLGTPGGVVAYSTLTRSLRCTKLLG